MLAELTQVVEGNTAFVLVKRVAVCCRLFRTGVCCPTKSLRRLSHMTTTPRFFNMMTTLIVKCDSSSILAHRVGVIQDRAEDVVVVQARRQSPGQSLAVQWMGNQERNALFRVPTVRAQRSVLNSREVVILSGCTQYPVLLGYHNQIRLKVMGERKLSCCLVS